MIKNKNELKNLTSQAVTVICKENESHPMGFRFTLYPGDTKIINYDVKANVYSSPPDFDDKYNEFANENLIFAIKGGGTWHVDLVENRFNILKGE